MKTEKVEMKLVETVLDNTVQLEDGYIRNVKILGFNSKNKRRYTESCMIGCQKLYEGRSVYVSHKKKGETMRDADARFGKLHNIRYEKGKGLYGDLEHLMTHPMAPRVREDLSKKLNYFGLSHDADGNGYMDEKGIQVVESIVKVNSVDLVSDPATNTSLLEQAAMNPETVQEPTPAEMAEQALIHAFNQAVLAVLNDETLDTMGKVAKIKEVLKAQDKLMAKEEKEEEPGIDTDGDNAIAEQEVVAPVSAEIIALQEQVASLAEQVKAMKEAKPKKYMVNVSKSVPVLEQVADVVDGIPSDLNDRRKFFYSK